MASLIRISFRSLGKPLSNQLARKESVRTITSKQLREKSGILKHKPKPWPYKEKEYTYLHQFIDRTTSRLDENSKIIVVEGPVASGKSALAKELAAELDMLYLPEANQDMLYFNKYGFDLRSLDDQLPEAARSFDINNFLVNPRHMNTAAFQLKQYCVKYSQYIDALAHVLSTGQGVVLDRSCYSDFVFLEAMFSQGYVSKGAYDMYYDARRNTLTEILHPHLVIYLDVSVPRIQQNIQKRALSYEVKSPVLTKEYLTMMEKHYKQSYLKEMSKHCELLIYDWSDGGEADVVVEDIERIDFENYDENDTKMQDWVHQNEEDWAAIRRQFCSGKHEMLAIMNIPMFNVPELSLSAEDAYAMDQVMDNAPGNEYSYGFNQSMGDKNVWFKMRGCYRDTLPVRERRQF